MSYQDDEEIKGVEFGDTEEDVDLDDTFLDDPILEDELSVDDEIGDDDDLTSEFAGLDGSNTDY